MFESDIISVTESKLKHVCVSVTRGSLQPHTEQTGKQSELILKIPTSSFVPECFSELSSEV